MKQRASLARQGGDSHRSLVHVRFQKPRQAMEAVVGVDAPNRGNEGFGVNELLTGYLFKGHTLQVE